MKKKIVLFLWGSLLFLLPLGCQTTLPPITAEFSVLTYNVHGLPAFITGDDTLGRMKLISPLLNGYDIAGVQENFAHSPELSAGITLPTIAHASQDPKDRAYASGLSIFSKFPLLDSADAAWEVCNGLVDSANDCLAYKGFQFVRLQIGVGLTLDVYNLHMDAGSSAGDQEARDKQIDQLTQAVKQRTTQGPYLVIGDFNMKIKTPRETGNTDEAYLKKLTDGLQLTDACEAVKCPEDHHIDRVFFHASGAWRIDALSWAREPQFVDAEGKDLSDHPAIKVMLRLTYTPPPQ